MKIWRILIFSLVIINNIVLANPQVIDKVAVIVNNDIVLKSEIDGIMNIIKLQAQYSDEQLPDDKTLRNQIIEQQIMNHILLENAIRNNMQVEDQELNTAIDNIALQHNIKTEELRSRLEGDGINYNDYRNQIRKEILITETRNNEVRQRFTISADEVKKMAEKINLENIQNIELNISQILIPLSEHPTKKEIQQQKLLANKIIEKIKYGSNFNRLALRYSSDAQAIKGGKIGWRKIEEMPILFFKVLSTAKIGDIIGPIHSDAGFHILKINDVLNHNDDNAFITEKFHIRHILLENSPLLNDEQAFNKLKQITIDIKNGKTTFIKSAQKFSEDKNSSDSGGDIGWFTPEMYEPELRNIILKLEKGQISEPVQSSIGWHLIQMIDRYKFNNKSTIQKNKAYFILFNRKFMQEIELWMKEQRAGAYINIIE
ncbi:peptidylprolyl isomerase SurA [Pantoea sp. Aalb]|uniref:peptidylprolyl isomerase SurA n=1 Tax=Pantoea sp. Aalb TaxID=2576762 RepID=UPI001320EDD9|nr:peptidylprolyl isomerase SurA [Pantoea sp. Aalb]MXP67170.1 peptidylprolyl isomerase SurA [Pantoea sp. Aalb]